MAQQNAWNQRGDSLWIPPATPPAQQQYQAVASPTKELLSIDPSLPPGYAPSVLLPPEQDQPPPPDFDPRSPVGARIGGMLPGTAPEEDSQRSSAPPSKGAEAGYKDDDDVTAAANSAASSCQDVLEDHGAESMAKAEIQAQVAPEAKKFEVAPEESSEDKGDVQDAHPAPEVEPAPEAALLAPEEVPAAGNDPEAPEEVPEKAPEVSEDVAAEKTVSKDASDLSGDDDSFQRKSKPAAITCPEDADTIPECASTPAQGSAEDSPLSAPRIAG